ncbi:hypothetical protein KR215_004857 [Drosophila sulfurigaster]|nr:hypothetical protein KR215_004857 [Drosophila sulfurigaster]
MASPPESPIEEVVYELEHTRVPKPIPVALEDLCRQTKFTKQEIRVMYRGFKTECPEGVVHEDCFKDIYAKFFPHGNSSLYAHYVFKAFDVNCNGAISFRVIMLIVIEYNNETIIAILLNSYSQDLLVTLSTLLRGSVYERLRWTFKLYDLNGDGRISRGELSEIVLAIHELMGRRPHQPEDDRKARDQVDRVFRKLDLNQDGIITIEEFLEACLKDDLVTRSLQMFDNDL